MRRTVKVIGCLYGWRSMRCECFWEWQDYCVRMRFWRSIVCSDVLKSWFRWCGNGFWWVWLLTKVQRLFGWWLLRQLLVWSQSLFEKENIWYSRKALKTKNMIWSKINKMSKLWSEVAWNQIDGLKQVMMKEHYEGHVIGQHSDGHVIVNSDGLWSALCSSKRRHFQSSNTHIVFF